MKAGEDKLNRVFFTTFKLLGNLSTFYSVALNGLTDGTTKVTSELEATSEKLYMGGTLANWLTNPEKVDDFYEIMQEQKQQITKRIKQNVKRQLDATAIVFAHSILDASVYGYLEILSLASPESFRIYTDKKQVSLSDVECSSYKQLHKQKIKDLMGGTIERESLIYKLDRFHEITKPSDTQMNASHKYERGKLVKFDKARHSIVHGNDWNSYTIDFAEELFYWNLLNCYLLRLVIKKTGLKPSQEGGTKYLLGL